MTTQERSTSWRKLVDLTLLMDNGGRRLGFERRLFSYTEHIPERRFGEERRCGMDRRVAQRTKL